MPFHLINSLKLYTPNKQLNCNITSEFRARLFDASSDDDARRSGFQ